MKESVQVRSVAKAAAASAALWMMVSPRRQTQVIMQAQAEAYSNALRAVLAVPPTEKEVADSKVRRLEHEMMIAGHELECEICQRPKTLREKYEAWRSQ